MGPRDSSPELPPLTLNPYDLLLAAVDKWEEYPGNVISGWLPKDVITRYQINLKLQENKLFKRWNESVVLWEDWFGDDGELIQA